MEVLENRVIEVNDLISKFNNMDFDGDSMIALSIHSEQAKRDFQKLFTKNLIEFEHTDELLIDYEHESIYAAYMLALEAFKSFNNIKENEDLSDLKELTIEDLNNINPGSYVKLYKLMKKGGAPFYQFDGKVLTYFELIINRLLDTIDIENNKLLYTFDSIGVLSKKNLSKLTYKFYKEWLEPNGLKDEFWDRIHIFNKFLLEAGTRIPEAIASFDFEDFAVYDEKIEEYKNSLIQTEPFLAFHQNQILFDDYVMPEIEKNEYNILNTLFKSGARLKSVQLLKAASNTGIPTDIYGKAFPINIEHSLLDGLTPEEYFTSGDSARLALAQRQDAIPKGGELQRKFFFATGILKQAQIDDCHTCDPDLQIGNKDYFDTPINKEHLKTLKYRWYLNEDTNQEEMIRGDEEFLIGKVIKLRTPMTCKLGGYQVCKKCLGEKRPETANLGAPTGQYLSEAIIQSILRTHHYGGAFLADIDKKLIEALKHVKTHQDNEIIIIESKDQESLNYIKDYLKDKYEPGEIEISEEENKLIIILNDLPFSEDAVKLLREATGIIDKNNKKKKDINITQSFLDLMEISSYNGILNIYFELVLSLLFYDEDNILYRYSDKEMDKQLALKDVIENIDPKLSIFYNFSNKTIKKIFSKKHDVYVDHMYRDLIDIYK